MAILNYTTKVSAAKTVGEIQEILSSGGARKVMIDYSKDREPVSVSFQIEITADVFVAFVLPCNAEGVLSALVRDKVRTEYRSLEHAKRVAWRVIKDWVEAQMAIIEAQQATMLQVFLPYAVTPEGTTMYEHVLNNQRLLKS